VSSERLIRGTRVHKKGPSTQTITKKEIKESKTKIQKTQKKRIKLLLLFYHSLLFGTSLSKQPFENNFEKNQTNKHSRIQIDNDRDLTTDQIISSTIQLQKFSVFVNLYVL
jgi:hypothetical protein